MIFAVVEPDLQSSELRDTVFDVVERIVVQVELSLPGFVSVLFDLGPIDAGSEAVVEGEPCVHAIIMRMCVVGVEIVLEGVDLGDPAEKPGDFLELNAFGTVDLFFRLIDFTQEGKRGQFGGHGGDFAEFDRGVSVGHERIVTAEE